MYKPLLFNVYSLSWCIKDKERLALGIGLLSYILFNIVSDRGVNAKYN